MGIAQGASPYIMVSVEGYDLTTAHGIMLAIETQQKTLLFNQNRVTVTGDGNEQLITVHLSQKETLSLSPGKADMQLRWRDENDENWTQEIVNIDVASCIYKGVV